VTGETEIFFLVAGSRLEQLIFIIGCVRIVTLEAITDSGLVNRPLDFRRRLVRVAGEAQRSWGRRNQLNARDVLVDADFVAACASS